VIGAHLWISDSEANQLMVTCYIALGSNLGERDKNIRLALQYLRQDPCVKIIKTSSLIETEPVGGPTQPKFLNAAAELKTSYSAPELLKRLQAIEIKLGRKTTHPKDYPRTIDLDILLYDDLKIDEQDLKIPHPRMWKREFVRVPLREIAPELFRQGSSSEQHT
jgi:2-amino-4-hydroxy-6-hydroxymethyldihydropteridine diphosphokinase